MMITPVADNFPADALLQAAWGSGKIPTSNAPDPLGAFRFICGAGQVSYDDPIVMPGRPGQSHLHQYFGNTMTNANSTYASTRSSGGSTCGDNNSGVAVNRSAYWMPAMLDGIGNVVRPDYVAIYYKRRPKSDPKCSLNGPDPQAVGNCVGIPHGIKFVFGWDPTGRNSTKTGEVYFDCQGPTAIPGHYPDLSAVATWCPATVGANGQRNQLGAVIHAPECWDGKNLDSPDHRSHVSYGSYGSWGYLRCPASHPFVMPIFTMQAWYTVDSNIGTWGLSSDGMVPGAPRGFTFHADYLEGWSPSVKAAWQDNCIDKWLTCSGGDLGNGRQIAGAEKPDYGWVNPQRLVPVPPNHSSTSTSMMAGSSPLKSMSDITMQNHNH